MSRSAWLTLRLASLLLLMLLLTACGARVSEPVCPSLVPYTAEEQNQMADELIAPPPKPALERAMRDYAGLRDQARACTNRS